MFKQMSLFSKILKAKFGVPEVNLNKNPITKMLLDDYTEDQFKAVIWFSNIGHPGIVP